MISDHVRILNLRKNKVIDAAALEKDWGIRPDQVVDFLALTGDTVDNVPGVPGIGEGFAATFLKQFGTLDNLLANVDQVKGPKKQQSLREHAETARRARRLVTLRDDLPLALDWDALKTQPPDVEALKALCTECGFHRFRDELGASRPAMPLKPEPTWEADYHARRYARAVRGSSSPSSSGSPGSASTPRRPRSTRSGPTWSGCRSAGRPARRTTCRVRGPVGSRLLDPAATLAALRPILADPAGREGRPEHQVRHAGPRAARASSWPGRSPTRWS